MLGTYHLSLALLDRDITAIQISGPFQRVSALQIEAAISEHVDEGFIGADLDRIREAIAQLPWIDQARVARRWPGRLSISVTEQVPAAVWSEHGLLNTRGELFLRDLQRVPPELPQLSGPDGRASDVAERYLAVREQLIPVGLNLKRLHLDERGSWQMVLSNGIEIRLGRRDVARRTDLFLDVVANIVASRAADISYVDMRYGNGFTIGWKEGAGGPADENPPPNREVFAARGAD